jgi:hypothetical protein
MSRDDAPGDCVRILPASVFEQPDAGESPRENALRSTPRESASVGGFDTVDGKRVNLCSPRRITLSLRWNG